ncbi:YicC/YloC family endoribonuclease [uncultured Vagococcus sp.]|uniref:YicC/YloC family endoribonuclease n=1 Tax=uncultured Vagococcus sp. TaxID=189676 RepID=UPI0028D1272D|nr:YicC/YloC family endoribonuclease [uncultured Vagococcus sp.]
MKSMTGFGKHTLTNKDYQIEVEVKSVNHRFLDMQIRMSREYNGFEMALRQVVKEELSRGRVEIGVFVTNERRDTKQLAINWQLMDNLMAQLKEAETRYDSPVFNSESIINGLINHDDFFEIVENKDQDTQLESYLVSALTEALVKLNKSRLREGQQIQGVLQQYLSEFKQHVSQIQELAALAEEDYQGKLTAKVQELIGEAVDETRLLTEVALLIERGDINEELDRLIIHIQKLADLLRVEKSVGRELDFLIQEMNREVNTIGSKSAPIAIKEAVVQMKTILEKIREQVQNIE